MSGADFGVVEFKVLVVVDRVMGCFLALLVLVACMAVETFVIFLDEIILVSDPHEKVHMIVHKELKINCFREPIISTFGEVGVIILKLLSLLLFFCLGDVVLHVVKNINVFNVLHPKDCQLHNRHF